MKIMLEAGQVLLSIDTLKRKEKKKKEKKVRAEEEDKISEI